VVLAGLLLSTLVGCGDAAARPQPVTVTGTATLNGQPIDSAVVTFLPVQGEYPAVGRIENGEIVAITTLKDGDGLIPGEHRITVFREQGEGGPVSNSVAIPSRFSNPDQSGLLCQVNPEGPNELKLELKSP